MTTTPPIPFRADQVGSLLRPARLLDARREHAAGRLPDEGLRLVEDECVAALVAAQEEAGMTAVTDGEARREAWHKDFIFSLPGMRAGREMEVPFQGPDGPVVWREPAREVVGRVAVTEPIFGDHIRFVQDHVVTGTPKLSIPSPNMVHSGSVPAAILDGAYPDHDAFLADLAQAYRDEIRMLADGGLTYLQVDDTLLPMFANPQRVDRLTRGGRTIAEGVDAAIDLFNAAVADRPDGLRVTTHMCRGNHGSGHVGSGGYDVIAEQVFSRLDVDGFFLEYDDERSGGFEPLRFLPKGKTVVLGLVTSKRGELEDKDAIKRRIEEAATYAPLDQLALSPQCGFSSTEGGNRLTEAEQWAKLRLVREIADEVWGD